MKAKVLKPIVPYSFEPGRIIEDAESLFGVAQTNNLIEQGYIVKMGTDIAEVEGLDNALSDRPVNTRVAAMIQNRLPTKVSELANDTGYVTHAQDVPPPPAVTSVNGKTGVVQIDMPDVPVKSVNGKTGDVNLSVPTKTSDLQNDSGFTNQADLSNAIGSKVDKATGKGLSSNDYTNAEKTKLSSVAPNATANDTDVNLKNRANHTGTQLATTITGLATVATSGSYTDLTSKPTLFSGSYTDLTNKPTLFSGNYNDLTNKPTIPTVNNALSASANITMPLITLGGLYSFTVTVTGATTAMCAIINFPAGMLDSLSDYSVNIEAANTVTVRLKAGVALAAGTRTFQIRVIP